MATGQEQIEPLMKAPCVEQVSFGVEELLYLRNQRVVDESRTMLMPGPPSLCRPASHEDPVQRAAVPGAESPVMISSSAATRSASETRPSRWARVYQCRGDVGPRQLHEQAKPRWQLSRASTSSGVAKPPGPQNVRKLSSRWRRSSGVVRGH